MPTARRSGHMPEVHSLQQDFADEVPGYLHNARICSLLEELDLKTGREHLAENLLRCYKMMTENKFLDTKEMILVDAWLTDMTGA